MRSTDSPACTRTGIPSTGRVLTLGCCAIQAHRVLVPHLGNPKSRKDGPTACVCTSAVDMDTTCLLSVNVRCSKRYSNSQTSLLHNRARCRIVTLQLYVAESLRGCYPANLAQCEPSITDMSVPHPTQEHGVMAMMKAPKDHTVRLEPSPVGAVHSSGVYATLTNATQDYL